MCSARLQSSVFQKEEGLLWWLQIPLLQGKNNNFKKKKHRENGFCLGESPHYFLFHQQISARPPNPVPIEKEELSQMDTLRRGRTLWSLWMCWEHQESSAASQAIPWPEPLPLSQSWSQRASKSRSKVWAVLFISMGHKCWKLEMKNLTSDLSNISLLMGSFQQKWPMAVLIHQTEGLI